MRAATWKDGQKGIEMPSLAAENPADRGDHEDQAAAEQEQFHALLSTRVR